MTKIRFALLALCCAALLIATPVIAVPECDLGETTSPGGGQASAWGKGSSCSASYDDLVAQVTAQAHANCNYGLQYACAVQTVVTAPCWWSSYYGQYITDGYANHGCLVQGDGFPRPEM